MKLVEIAQRLGLKVEAGVDHLENEVRGGYAGDLLSCVMARAKTGDLWVTVQRHPNIVAVAVLVGLAGIVVTEGGNIEPATLERAEREGIPILVSSASAFRVVGELWDLGIRGE